MSKEIKIEGKNEGFCEQVKRNNAPKIVDIEVPDTERDYIGDVATAQIPVGAKNRVGVEVVKPQTDLDNYEDWSDPDTCRLKKKDETLGEYILHRYQEECKRDEIKHEYDDALLSEQDERTVKRILNKKSGETKSEMSPYEKERLERLQNFIGKRLNKEDIIELFDKLDELEKEYVPKENIDTTKKINDLDIIMAMKAAREKLAKAHCEKECCCSHQEEEMCDDKCNLDKAMTFDRICHEIMELHARKNKDYGNAADASYREFGITSYVIRLNDKMNRLKSLTKPGTTMEVKDESIIDTLKDLAAYSIMAIESLLN